ncbi:MAG TPA: autotransporter outer membrane beta-barrel domain-containing protein [Rickettsiales bacterium]|nr:autotransporter outer membrane beta-barrel domain-containing protein [Rickettsiales bacterium]
MPIHARVIKKIIALSALPAVLFAQSGWAHTVSVGYESAGAGTVDFWYGTYHSPAQATYTEGSMSLVGIGNSFSSTTPFTLLTSTKPGGLVDGTTNFFTDGTSLVAVNTNGTVQTWQGVQITGLTPGTYRFTYIPIASPTSVWAPWDSVILSSIVTLSASITGSSFSPNASPSSNEAAAMLDSITSTATGDMANVITTLQGMSTDEQHNALQHIAPQTNTAIAQASTQTVSGSLDSVETRLEGLRSQGYTTTAADDLFNGKSIQVADNGDLAETLSGDVSKKHSVWAKVIGSYDNQGMKDGFAGYTSKTGGMVVGGDTLLGYKWVGGVALAYAETDVSMHDYRSGDSTKIGSYQITGYTSRDFGKWYMEGMTAYARQRFDTSRDTIVSGVAQGSFNGDQVAARLTAGVPIAIKDQWTLTPTAGMEINYMHQDDYTETGAGALSLSVDSASATRVRSVIGAKLATEAEYGEYTLRPSVHTAWRHEFHNNGIDSTAAFVGGGTNFTTTGESLERNNYNFGGAVNISKTKDFSLTAQVDTDRASSYAGYTGQVLAQWKF